MKRYTSKALDQDIAAINKRLDGGTHPYRFLCGGGYGMASIDLATPEQLARHCCQRRLIMGTPRECINAVHCYLAGVNA